MLLFLLLVSASPDPWTQLGLGALVAAPPSSFCWVLWRTLGTERSKNEALQRDQITRERELSDRLGPLLAEAVKVLATAPERFDQALGQAQRATATGEVDSMMRKLEETVERISRERGK